ncbi:threonylcarbamoyl-AMP synthase [Leuconostoc litchii]|uniref:Threonylcarbamoyl-AMP synthase n=1 Tax=Leuconostoc litchii TaxID=1981069 RepID=A0A652NE20_9LACO|nr:L-threonylcarbamoyladenylate synthase [Leuconostoc litchii]TYC46502.1 threonylcarbamoyl-AMP synthase [Leuconostoc litchii]GMA70183.1 threonylcarbamoyl-AMP synthase [Leuconostoc litchii]
MNTKIFKTTKNDIEEASRLISQGEVVAFPTETVYGLGADATNEVAIKKVFIAKGRPADNPLIMTVADVSQLDKFVTVSEQAKKLMDKFWPGSLTIILPIKVNQVSMMVTGGLQTVAFRLPDNDATRELIRNAGRPIVGPSANTSGKPSPTTAQHVWHDMKNKIAGIVDDGPTQVGVESTVVDMSVVTPIILRPGAVTQQQLEEVLQVKVVDATSTESVASDVTPKAPGMKYRHYAPDKNVVMFDELDALDLKHILDLKDVVIAQDHVIDSMSLKNNQAWSLGETLETATEQLFAGLRFYDDEPQIATIYVQKMPPIGIGKAFNNRLGKAAGNQEFQF